MKQWIMISLTKRSLLQTELKNIQPILKLDKYLNLSSLFNTILNLKSIFRWRRNTSLQIVPYPSLTLKYLIKLFITLMFQDFKIFEDKKNQIKLRSLTHHKSHRIPTFQTDKYSQKKNLSSDFRKSKSYQKINMKNSMWIKIYPNKIYLIRWKEWIKRDLVRSFIKTVMTRKENVKRKVLHPSRI